MMVSSWKKKSFFCSNVCMYIYCIYFLINWEPRENHRKVSRCNSTTLIELLGIWDIFFVVWRGSICVNLTLFDVFILLGMFSPKKLRSKKIKIMLLIHVYFIITYLSMKHLLIFLQSHFRQLVEAKVWH